MLGFYKDKLCHIQAGISHFNENIIKQYFLHWELELLSQFPMCPICETFIYNNEGIV